MKSALKVVLFGLLAAALALGVRWLYRQSADVINGGGSAWYEDKLLEDAENCDGPDEIKTDVGIEMPPEVALGKSLLEILECEQMISKITASTSYTTGHPMDINALLTAFHDSIAGILKAFATTKGGFEPKFHKKDGLMVPYWTKTQIRQAKLKG